MANSKRGWTKYLIGAVLAYAFCIVSSGASFSTDLLLVLQLGTISGAFFFMLIGPIHFLFQLLVHFLINKFRPAIGTRISAIIINLPAAVLVIVIFTMAVLPISRAALREKFEEHIMSPIPPSTEVKSFTMLCSFNEGDFEIVFKINSKDLVQLLATEGYQLKESNLDDEALNHYRLSASKATKNAVQLTTPASLYFVETNSGTAHLIKNLIVSSNSPTILFLENFH